MLEPGVESQRMKTGEIWPWRPFSPTPLMASFWGTRTSLAKQDAHAAKLSRLSLARFTTPSSISTSISVRCAAQRLPLASLDSHLCRPRLAPPPRLASASFCRCTPRIRPSSSVRCVPSTASRSRSIFTSALARAYVRSLFRALLHASQNATLGISLFISGWFLRRWLRRRPPLRQHDARHRL